MNFLLQLLYIDNNFGIKNDFRRVVCYVPINNSPSNVNYAFACKIPQ